MKIYNVYILAVALLLLLTAAGLITAGQRSIGVYYTVFVIETLVVTELFVYFNTRARHGLNVVSVFLFGGISLLVVLQIFRMLVR